ncbi:MFS transporter [Lysinibacillus sp. 54212]|uniref:MFS transporter n=1 Tax=Lysinibacillus sp. 54212 TaxID=3119829 RepID=UPI002FCB82B1
MNTTIKYKKATYHLYTFLVSKMFSSLGANVYAFGMSMFILSLTGSSLSFAVNLILSVLPRTIISPIVGVLGDRMPRKWLVLGGQLGIVITLSLLLVYSIFNGLSLGAIYMTTVFYTTFSSFSSVAFSASIANLVDEERLQKAMSFNQLSYSVSGIGGPILGGMLFGFVSMETFLIINIVSMLITFIFESTMDFNLFKRENVQMVKENMLDSLKQGVQYVNSQPVIKAIMLTALWLNLFFTCLNVGGDFIFLEKLKMNPEHIGITEAAGAIGMLVASIYLASRKSFLFPLLVSKRAVFMMSLCIGIFAIPLLLSFQYSTNFVYYTVAMGIFGILTVMTNTPIGVIFQTSVAEEYRARVFGLLEMMAMSMMPIGTILYGVLFDFLPASFILIVSSILLVIVTVLTLRKSVLFLAHPELKNDAIQVKRQKKTFIQMKNETFYPIHRSMY